MSKYDEMRKELKYSIIDLDADHYNLSKFMQVIDEIFIKYRGDIEQPKIGCWIPCSERLPEESGFYMVTKKIKETGNRFTGKSRFDIEKGWNDSLDFVDIVAWQPLLEEYHG